MAGKQQMVLTFSDMPFVMVGVVFLMLYMCPNFCAATTLGMYWTDYSDGHIHRANLDGSGVITLLDTGSRSGPCDILVNYENQSIYWSEWKTQTIKTANILGTAISTVINVGSNGCSGFDIDFSSNLIFWAAKTGGFYDSIQRATLSGAGQTTLVQFSSGKGGAVDIALDPYSEQVYWTRTTDRASDLIQRTDYDTSNFKTLCMTGMNPCDLELDFSNGKMYWTESNGYSPGFVCRANLDGTRKETLISGLDDPYGLALDLTSGKMYWADSGTGIIGRSNLDGTGVETILTGLSEPWGLTIAPIPEPATSATFLLGILFLKRSKIR